MAEASEPHVIRQQLAELITLIRHGAELVHAEGFAILAWAGLDEQHGAAEVDGNKQREQKAYRQKNRERQHYKQGIKKALHKGTSERS